MNFWWILYILDWLVFVPVALTTLYLFLFSLASLIKNSKPAKTAKRGNRFIVLIPAYRADGVILSTVNSILGQTYTQRNFDVVVISDHQSEITNFRLAQLPITLLTPNFDKSSKVKSIQYAILNLPQFKIYDTVVLLDAGNVVEPEFLQQVNDAYESAGTKAIQCHRLARNRDTTIARLDAIFEEINNSVFRRGHLTVGLSAALNSSGMVFDYQWFKQNIMKVRVTVGENKELESILVREGIYVEYFDDILVYDEKTRDINDFHVKRVRWILNQYRSLATNIRYLPAAILNRHYDQADKILQWMLIPRIFMVFIFSVFCLILPFVYFTMVIKWWVIAVLFGFSLAIATPDYLVDKHWDTDFLMLPFRIAWNAVSMLTNSKKNPKKTKKS